MLAEKLLSHRPERLQDYISYKHTYPFMKKTFKHIHSLCFVETCQHSFKEKSILPDQTHTRKKLKKKAGI